ncbi:U11/U12 small nuclear ribonucleoprotein 48 kDa protein [Anabrus simplex]|uniref:U11/U12 small nuclear ribonucleoprotein 48 kDa protein n=1 Tax=Anabrus simplex TaxID=316456 RepID=UPI0035A2655A
MLSLGEIAARKAQLKVLNEFIERSHSRVKSILEALGWDEEKTLLQTEEMVHCPNNAEHRVPKSKLSNHVKICNWKQEGYHELDVPLPENCGPYADRPETSIVIDKDLQKRIIEEAAQSNPSMITGVPVAAGLDYRSVPQTSNRLFSDFTSDERLALYDYAVSKTAPPAAVKMEELHAIDLKKEDKPRPKTKLEILIEERNAKRRRMKYRNNVHTSRKSHTEIMREVIKNQMDVLEEMIKSESGEKSFEVNSPDNKNNELAETFIEHSVDPQEIYHSHERSHKRDEDNWDDHFSKVKKADEHSSRIDDYERRKMKRVGCYRADDYEKKRIKKEEDHVKKSDGYETRKVRNEEGYSDKNDYHKWEKGEDSQRSVEHERSRTAEEARTSHSPHRYENYGSRSRSRERNCSLKSDDYEARRFKKDESYSNNNKCEWKKREESMRNDEYKKRRRAEEARSSHSPDRYDEYVSRSRSRERNSSHSRHKHKHKKEKKHHKDKDRKHYHKEKSSSHKER